MTPTMVQGGTLSTTTRQLVCLLMVVVLSGCMSVASERMTGHLKAAMLGQDDPETVRAAAPAFLLLTESMIAESPNDPNLLMAGAELSSAYAALLLDPERRRRGILGIIGSLNTAIEEREAEPRDDFITELLHAEHDGEPITRDVVMGMCALLLIAGLDTTWSSIGSTMWHLATHPDDRRRLVDEPELMPTAIEEFLRAYAPVTMARRIVEDTEYNGCPIKAEERILMNFPAANRDPDVFPDADTVILDRSQNRHLAFGAGIHRCAGSNLARMELRVSVEEWLARMPDFEVADAAGVTWAGGQVRGPRTIPIRVS